MSSKNTTQKLTVYNPPIDERFIPDSVLIACIYQIVESCTEDLTNTDIQVYMLEWYGIKISTGYISDLR